MTKSLIEEVREFVRLKEEQNDYYLLTGSFQAAKALIAIDDILAKWREDESASDVTALREIWKILEGE